MFNSKSWYIFHKICAIFIQERKRETNKINGPKVTVQHKRTKLFLKNFLWWNNTTIKI